VPFPTGAAALLPAVRHTITFRRISLLPVRLTAPPVRALPHGWAWVDPERPELPTSTLLGKLVRAVAAVSQGGELGRGRGKHD
jgi:hypothetical protein